MGNHNTCLLVERLTQPGSDPAVEEKLHGVLAGAAQRPAGGRAQCPGLWRCFGSLMLFSVWRVKFTRGGVGSRVDLNKQNSRGSYHSTFGTA